MKITVPIVLLHDIMRQPIHVHVCFERHAFRNKSSVFPILFSLEKNNKTLKRP